MAQADMAIGVHHILIGKNAVGDTRSLIRFFKFVFGMGAPKRG